MRKSEWSNICTVALRAAYIRSIIGKHSAWFYVYEDTQTPKGPTLWRQLQMRYSVWNNACTVRWTAATDAQVGSEHCLYCRFDDCSRCADYESDYKLPIPWCVSLHCVKIQQSWMCKYVWNRQQTVRRFEHHHECKCHIRRTLEVQTITNHNVNLKPYKTLLTHQP